MRRTLGLVALAVLVLVSPALAAEGGGHDGGLINLDKSLIIQVINFLILLFILWKLLYKPLVAPALRGQHGRGEQHNGEDDEPERATHGGYSGGSKL